MAESSNDACKICSGVFEKNNPEVKVGKKALTTLLNASKARREKEDYLRAMRNTGRKIPCFMEMRKVNVLGSKTSVEWKLWNSEIKS